MARADQVLTALKYQIAQCVTHIKATYSTIDDVLDTSVFHIEPFDEQDAKSYAPTLGVSGYSFIVTRFTTEQRSEYPVGFLNQIHRADIIVCRKTLKTIDRTNNRNIVQFGGTDGQSQTVTSIERIATDLQKWFRVSTQGGKLSDGTTERAFKCDITSLGEFAQAGDFYYKVLPFECYTQESVTISAT